MQRQICPMQTTENQRLTELEADFELLWCMKIQKLAELRRSKMSQTTMAAMTGRSLKTIQRFENYKSKDTVLLFLYRNILLNENPDKTAIG